MAGIFLNPGGCCGCGTSCGNPCTSCGGVILDNGGTVTDSNGTMSLYWAANAWHSPGSWTVAGSHYPAWIFNSPATSANSWVNNSGICLASPQFLVNSYQYAFWCDNSGNMVGAIIMYPLQQCGSNPSICGYFQAVDGIPNAFQIDFTCVFTPTCSGGFVTGTAPFVANTTTCPGKTFNPPGGTVNISLPLATTRDQICCNPCGIPKTNLTCTVTIDGGTPTTSTLVYNSGANTWSDGTNTLSCNAGSTRLVDPRGTHTAWNSWACNPYHLEYGYSSGGHSYVIDIDA